MGLHLGYMLSTETITTVNDFELSLELDVISVPYKPLISRRLHRGKLLEWRREDKLNIHYNCDRFLSPTTPTKPTKPGR